jgi:hypothetical protein
MQNFFHIKMMHKPAACAWLAVLALVALGTACGDKTDTSAQGDATVIADVDVDSPDGLTDQDTTADGVVPADVTETTDTADAADVAPIDGDTGGDTDVIDPDTGGGTDVVEPPKCQGETSGAAGCPCTSVEQCDSGFCIDTPSGQQCADFCTSTCADDFKCTTASGPGGDVVNICVPRYGKVCNPCNANSECEGPGNGGARCVDQGNNGAFCGSACQASEDCPSGYECKDATDVAGQTSKQCVVKDGGACSCSDAAMAKGLATKCFVVSGDSSCEGKRTCQVGSGLSGCQADAPDAEVCDAKDNDCDGQTDESTCDDNNPCTEDLCGGLNGCGHTNNKLPCNADSSVCTKDDTCDNGKCVAGKIVVCDDNNVCTTDSCDPAVGCKFDPADNTPCNADDSECTVNDACKAGVCEAGAKKSCDTGDQCIEGKCSVLTGKCSYLVKDGVPCNDGNPCTAAEKCVADQCQGSAVSCDDQNGCTADSCDQKTGCVHTNLTTVCDDKDACTDADICKDGACAGAAVNVGVKCDDSDACTTDACDKVAGCTHKAATGGQCDDGNPCTINDTCDAGKCLSGQNNCICTTDLGCASKEDGNACNGTLFCDKSKLPYACNVNPVTVIKCDESVNGPCQTNSCDPSTGLCKLLKKPNDLPCDADDNVCTQNDKCADGQCQAGVVQVCDDKNGCTNDSCDTKAGCKFTPNTNACDADGNACTEGDACAAGSCVAGKSKVCNDNEACTKGEACGVNTQTGKYTCLVGAPKSCDDSNGCTKDTCDTTTGCKLTIDATLKAACYTGDPKTRGKGLCKDGSSQCGIDGKAGPCVGDVVPDPKGDPCDGLDNDCDGVTDKGCAPTDFSARFTTGSLSGQSGDKMMVHAITGSSLVSGSTTGDKYTANLGFISWVKAVFGL